MGDATVKCCLDWAEHYDNNKNSNQIECHKKFDQKEQSRVLFDSNFR